jgi:signal transduction histidine kinase
MITTRLNKKLFYRLPLLFLLFTSLVFARVEESVLSLSGDWVKGMFHTSAPIGILPEFNDSYGVVFRDLNNDGEPDLYVVRFRDLNRLFINQGEERPFLDFTIQSGLGGNLMVYGKQNLELGASAADTDNDGTQDILIAGWGLTTYLFYQREDLSFPDKYPFAELYYPLDGNAGIWADVNRDGYLDLFVTDEHDSNHLFINEGNEHFINRTDLLAFNLENTSQGAAFGDADGDGYPDLYVCNWFAPDMFYRNVNGKNFVPVDLPLPHLQTVLNSNSASFGDIDNDGDLDLVVTDRQGGTRLYQNNTVAGENWEFTDITEISDLQNPYPAYSSIIADLNNDGWQDVFFTNIGPNLLFLNSDSVRFTLAFTERIPLKSTRRHYSTGAAVADFDKDGDLDLFAATRDTHSVFYRNPLNNGNYLRFQLEGVKSNRDAIGTKIWLYRETTEKENSTLAGYREIHCNSGYLSASELTAHFGAALNTLYSARIQFPSGEEIFLDNLSPGQVLYVTETGGIQKSLLRTWQHLSRVVQGEQFWINLLLFAVWVALISGFIILSIRRYHWQNNQTALFLISIMMLGYLLFLLLSGSETWFILVTQISVLMVLMVLITGFMEKIHRLEVQRYGYRQLLQNFSRQLIFIKNNDELYQQMVTIIHQSMNVNYCCALAFAEPDSNKENQDNKKVVARFKTAAGNWKNDQFQLSFDEKDITRFLETPLIKLPGEDEHSPEFAETNPQLLLPLTRKEKLFALLLLGRRQDGKDFHPEDLGVLQILAGQAAIAIENNLYIEESKKLIQKLTEAEIREHYVKELEEANRILEQLYKELQQTQTQLIQSEKMGALGQLVAGVAHELNNPISFVYANMKELQHYSAAVTDLLELLTENIACKDFQDKLQEKLAELDQEYDLEFIRKDMDNLIGESLAGSQRVKDVVQNLRNFSRLDEAEYKAVDLHEGLESTLILLNHEIKNRIELHKKYGQLPKVFCNPGHINQVFMNLLHNATQAIENKGDIWITTRQVDHRVEIEIRDNGKGIPENIQNKIFDPFFTTKTVGKGTGLGLSISYSIIEKHGGEILLESEEGKGTTFTVILPVKNRGHKVEN